MDRGSEKSETWLGGLSRVNNSNSRVNVFLGAWRKHFFFSASIHENGNSDTFCVFVLELSRVMPRDSTLLFDSSPIHCSSFPVVSRCFFAKFASLIRATKITPILLQRGQKASTIPVYSPAFNPCELLFGILKIECQRSIALQSAGSVEQLALRLGEAANELFTPALLTACFKKCGYF